MGVPQLLDACSVSFVILAQVVLCLCYQMVAEHWSGMNDNVKVYSCSRASYNALQICARGAIMV